MPFEGSIMPVAVPDCNADDEPAVLRDWLQAFEWGIERLPVSNPWRVFAVAVRAEIVDQLGLPRLRRI